MFFSIIFFALTNKDNIIMDWQCSNGLFFISLSFIFLFVFFSFFYVLIVFPIHCYIHSFIFVVLRGFVIVCHSIQHHIVALESDIDIFKYFFLPMRKPEQKHTFRQVALQRGPFLFLSLEDSKVEF